VKRTAAWTAAAAVLPVVAVFIAWQLNLSHGFDRCNPFLDGCTSVSRAVRSGPGLAWFKALALPAAVCMALAWKGIPPMLGGGVHRSRWTTGLGWVSAAAFALYAIALGGAGDFYGWMRQYGVVMYFGGCGLAQLLVAAQLTGRPQAPTRIFQVVVGLTWLLGVISAFKRRLVDDPQLQDRLQNALEWHFSTNLSLGMLALAWCLTACRNREPGIP
jgi:hypothetical protein